MLITYEHHAIRIVRNDDELVLDEEEARLVANALARRVGLDDELIAWLADSAIGISREER